MSSDKVGRAAQREEQAGRDADITARDLTVAEPEGDVFSAAAVLEARGLALAGRPDRAAIRDWCAQALALTGSVGLPGELAGALLRLRLLTLSQLVELGDSAAQAVAVGESLAAELAGALGLHHPDTLDARNSLGMAYQAMSRTVDAIALFEPTLVARQQLLGPDHPDTLTSQNNLAAGYHYAGRAAEAIPLFERNLADRERVLGPDHPDTLISRGNLAVGYREAGRTAEATALFERNLADRERVLGPDHPETLASRNSLAAAYRDVGRTDAIPAPERTAAVGDDRPMAGPGVQVPPAGLLDRPGKSGRRFGGHLPYPRRIRVLSLAAAILILLVAGGVMLAVSGRDTGGHRSGRGALPASDPIMRMAADWVRQQISRSVIVACDPAMCSALEARGVPAANLLILRTTAVSLLDAEVLVATPAVRSQLGSRLDSVYAPSVIAGFGSGPGEVNVRVVAPDGAAAYRAALRRDVAARMAAGAQLLANRRILMTAKARKQLATGDVDSRLLILLPVMAATHPVQILAFGDPAPGASSGVPLCSADLSGSGRAAGMIDASYMRWLDGFLRAQLVPFAGSAVMLKLGKQPIIRVEFSRPSPLGLLPQG